MDHSNNEPSRRQLLGLAAGAGVATVAGLASSAPGRAAQAGINSLIAVTQRKVEQAAAEAAALEGAEKQRALLRDRGASVSQLSEVEARRVRSQALLNTHLQEIADNLARMQGSAGVC